MTSAFDRAVGQLAEASQRFDVAGHAAKLAGLRRLTHVALRDTPSLSRLHDLLLYLRAHPGDAAQLASVEAALGRMAAWLRRQAMAPPGGGQREGMPWVPIVTRFSHDGLKRLLAHPHCRVNIESFADARSDLNDLLRLSLPSLERSQTNAGLERAALLDALRVPKTRRLAFIVEAFERFDASPFVKDYLFDALGLYVCVRPTQRRFSLAYNRLPMHGNFFQPALLRDFDAKSLMNQPLPAARRLDAASGARVAQVLGDALTLTVRETDPVTYLDPRALQVVDLERGLAVATYGMVPARQLPLESYVGFTLFKNGLAVAYGGAWLFGRRADFGMNIFEAYRGGESGYMMCQVLRVYRQRFGVDFFEVDAHQFGLDNPDGIRSGAFWFYYRHGFRPLDAALARLARQERERIVRQAGYRSSERTLLRFTASSVALNFGAAAPPRLQALTNAVTRHIQRAYAGQRALAESECVRRFIARAGTVRGLDEDRRRVLTEVALVAEALAIGDARRLQVLRAMVRTKPSDLAGYQRLWFEFFGGGKPTQR